MHPLALSGSCRRKVLASNSGARRFTSMCRSPILRFQAGDVVKFEQRGVVDQAGRPAQAAARIVQSGPETWSASRQVAADRRCMNAARRDLLGERGGFLPRMLEMKGNVPAIIGQSERMARPMRRPAPVTRATVVPCACRDPCFRLKLRPCNALLLNGDCSLSPLALPSLPVRLLPNSRPCATARTRRVGPRAWRAGFRADSRGNRTARAAGSPLHASWNWRSTLPDWVITLPARRSSERREISSLPRRLSPLFGATLAHADRGTARANGRRGTGAWCRLRPARRRPARGFARSR